MCPFPESLVLGVPCLPYVPCMWITFWDVTSSWVVYVLVAFQRWCVPSRPYTSCTNPSWVGSLPSSTGRVVWEPPFLTYYYCWGYWGPRPPCPYRVASYRAAFYCVVSYCVASSTVILARGYQEGTLPWPAKLPERLYYSEPERRPRPVNPRGRSTLEAVDLKETPSCPAVLHNKSFSRGPTMLTLVNAQGPYGT